jgi:hypothetical protein
MKKLLLLILALVSVNVSAQTLEQFRENYNVGFRDKATKKVVIQPVYTSATDFIDGIAAVSETPLGSPNMAVKTKWRIIDIKGNYITPDSIEFDKVDVKKNGIALVYFLVDKYAGGRYSYNDNYKVGVFRKDGTFILPCEYDEITEMNEGYLRAYAKELGIAVLDKKGTIVIGLQNEYRITEYVGCGLFQYINPGGKRTAMNDPLSGGLVDSALKIWINQDSVEFVPSFIINPTNCTNKSALLGLTQPPRVGSAGIYRVGYGLVVPTDTYKLEKDNKGSSSHKYKIASNLITITDESFDNRFASDKTGSTPFF